MAEDLRARLARPEDNFTERKPERQGAGRQYREAIVAFANSVPEGSTAVLFIGIDDHGKPIGVGNPDKLQKTIREICTAGCYPPVLVSIEVLDVDGKSIVAVVVPHSTSRPHFAGQAYLRIGSTNQAASPQLLDELILSRNSKLAFVLEHRHDLWTVRSYGRKIGDPQPLEVSYSEHAQCRITEVNAHYVRFNNISSGMNYTEPVDSITLHFDERQQRPMIVVGGR